MVINKKLVRGSLSVKMRLGGCFAIILFSVALMVSFSVSMKSVAARLDTFRAANAVHDIRVKTVKQIDSIENAEYEARYIVDAYLADGKMLHISSLTERIDIAYITQGAAATHSGEMLLDSMFARSGGISVGDTLEILGKKFTVCGFYTSPDTILPAKTAEGIMVSSDSFGLAAMSENDIRQFNGCETEYLIKLENNSNSEMNKVINDLNEKYILTDCKKAREDNRATYIDGDFRQHRTKHAWRLCTRLACIFSVILHSFRLTGASLPALNLYNLTKNLTSQSAHNLCAVLP